MFGLLDMLLGPLGALLGAVVTAVAIFFVGRRSGKTTAERDAAKARGDTYERMQDADLGDADTPDQHREWLRERGER